MYNDLNNDEVAIIAKSPVESDETELLSIIKYCLERDYVFRTKFANRRVILDYEKVNNEANDKKDWNRKL